MTWNVATTKKKKKLADQNRIKCLFNMIGQSDKQAYVELLRIREKYVLGAQRTVRNKEDKTSFRLGRSAESFVASQTSWHNLRGLPTLRNPT